MNVLDNYEILSILGEGTFGIVKLAQDKKTKEKVAIKILEKKKIKAEEDKRRVKTEIEILQRMSHINVIKTKKILKDLENIYIIMEYCEKGELFHHIEKEICLSNDEAASYFYQLINGLEYIHQKGIVHRDLKLENILLSKNNILKIIDFGLSSYYYSNKLLSTPCGSPCYASPELLSGQKYDGILIDVWSTGVILYAMLCGYLPFDDDNHGTLYKRIINTELDIPEHLEEDSVDMLKKILVNEPKKRITIKEIKKHKFYIKGKKEFIRGHPNIVKLINKKITYLGQNGKNRKIRIIKNRNDINEMDNKTDNQKENIINNDDLSFNIIKVNEKNSINGEKYANEKIANIFKEELMKKILKRKIKINFDSLLINSINLNINNDNNSKSQKNCQSLFNNNTSIKIDYNKDLKRDILKTISYTRNQGKNYMKYKNNKTFNVKDKSFYNNNLSISNLKQNKYLLTNKSTAEKGNINYNKYNKNMNEKIYKIPLKTNKNNNNKKLNEKKKRVVAIKNIKLISNKNGIDPSIIKKMSITPRFEIRSINLIKEKNNNDSYRPTISGYDIKNQHRKNNFNTNVFTPKQYYKKVINQDDNLYININSMKDFDVTKVINNDYISTIDNQTLSYSIKNKNMLNNEIRLKKKIDYLKSKFKMNNKNHSNYKDNFKSREPKNDSIEDSKTFSNYNHFNNFNKNITYKRIFNNSKKKSNDTNKIEIDIMNNYSKENINEKKFELKDFKNKEITDYILTNNNIRRNTINYEKLKLMNNIKREIYSSKLVNFNKDKEPKKINRMNHYENSTIKNNTIKIKQLYDIKLNPKKYKYNLSINKNKSLFQNHNEHNHKKDIKLNSFSNKNIKINNNEKIKNNPDKKKLLSKINSNNNFFSLMNNINKSLDDINYNFNNDRSTSNYLDYYNLKTDYNLYN